MKRIGLILIFFFLFLSSCQPSKTKFIVIADGKIYQFTSSSRLPKDILSGLGLRLSSDDRILANGITLDPNSPLPGSESVSLVVRRAVSIDLITLNGENNLQSSALTVGQALTELGHSLTGSDFIDPPAGTPINGPLTITYHPSRSITIAVDGSEIKLNSSAVTVGQALAQAGLSITGLDTSSPPENELLPANGRIQLHRVTETVALTEQSIPFMTRTEPSADLELDQQALLQGGQPGLSMGRVRSRLVDGSQVSQITEKDALISPPQDRILGYGTKVVIRSAVVDGEAIQYYRVLTLLATSYSPCRSATPNGSCSYGTSSGMPVQKGTVAMVYSWYLAFGHDPLFITGYGHANVGDVGGGPPGNHYWIDLGFSDSDYQPVYGPVTVYFLTPVPANLVYILP